MDSEQIELLAKLSDFLLKEAAPIEGLADGTPPCGVFIEDDIRCGKPSVARVKFYCSDCQKYEHNFVCKECLTLLYKKDIICGECGARNYRWEET